jgi:hypothetical protein
MKSSRIMLSVADTVIGYYQRYEKMFAFNSRQHY